jgi:hypothetical protein
MEEDSETPGQSTLPSTSPMPRKSKRTSVKRSRNNEMPTQSALANSMFKGPVKAREFGGQWEERATAARL